MLSSVDLLLSPFLLPLSLYPYPLNPPKGLGERFKLPQRVQAEPSRQTFLAHFQTEISTPFVEFLELNQTPIHTKMAQKVDIP